MNKYTVNLSVYGVFVIAFVLSLCGGSLRANEDSKVKSANEPPVIFTEKLYTDSLYEYIKDFTDYQFKYQPLIIFPFELVATRGGDESHSPLYEELFDYYNQGPRFKNWRVRLECSFDRYLCFYRLKERVAHATVEEIDECVNKMNEESTAQEQALIMISVFLFERMHRPYYGPEEMVKKDKEFWKKDQPLYFVEMLPNYAPDASISEEQWEKWIDVIRAKVGDRTSAFFYHFASLRAVEKDDYVFTKNDDLSIKDPNDAIGSLIHFWTSNIELRLSNLEQLTGESCPIEEFTASDPLKRYESCRRLFSSINKKIEGMQDNERDFMLALRDYWLSFSCGRSFMPEQDRGSCIGNGSKIRRSCDVIARQLLYARLEYRKELAEQGRIWSEDVEKCWSEEETSSDSDSIDTKLKFDSEFLPIVFDEHFEEDSLYEYIKRESPNMKIFPFELVATRSTFYHLTEPFYWELYNHYNEFRPCHVWRERYETTFELYLPFYRFKEKVCRSTAQEIDECVNKIDECTPKEQALILTSVFIFERLKRPFLGPEKMLQNDGPFDRHRHSFYYEHLTDYSPDTSITDEQWEKWTETLVRFSKNTQIAFPAFRPDQRYCFSRGYCDKLYISPEDLKKWKLLADWSNDLDRCLMWLQTLVGETPSKSEFAAEDSLDRHESCRKLFFALEKVAQESEGNKRDLTLALRDYWLSLDFGRLDTHSSGINEGHFCGGNSSAMPKRLNIIASQLRYARFEYKKERLDQGIIWNLPGGLQLQGGTLRL